MNPKLWHTEKGAQITAFLEEEALGIFRDPKGKTLAGTPVMEETAGVGDEAHLLGFTVENNFEEVNTNLLPEN